MNWQGLWRYYSICLTALTLARGGYFGELTAEKGKDEAKGDITEGVVGSRGIDCRGGDAFGDGIGRTGAARGQRDT